MQWIFVLAIAFGLIAIMKKGINKTQKNKIVIKPNDTVDEQYNAKKQNIKIELDFLLDKVSKRGINSLTPNEKSRLEILSESI